MTQDHFDVNFSDDPAMACKTEKNKVDIINHENEWISDKSAHFYHHEPKWASQRVTDGFDCTWQGSTCFKPTMRSCMHIHQSTICPGSTADHAITKLILNPISVHHAKNIIYVYMILWMHLTSVWRNIWQMNDRSTYVLGLRCKCSV